MDNDYNSNDYYQDSSSSGSTNKYSLNKSSDDINLNGQSSAPQQSPYGGSNPYGNQSPYGGSNPYGNQNPYGGSNPYGDQNPYGGSPYGGAYQNPTGIGAAMSQAVVSADVNDVLVKSFLLMFVALLVTGITSLIAAQSNFLLADPSTAMVKMIVCFVVEFALVIGATSAVKKNNAAVAGVLFFLYSVVNGLTLSIIFYVYTSGSITKVFFITALVFGLMAGIGYFTKMDLTKLGNILMIGLLGIIIGSVANMFMKSDSFDYFITVVGIGIFMGLTAYDVQKIKKLASGYSYLDPMVIGLYGAIELYLDFINLFLKLLRIMGRAKR
jgi:Integral membrane protein, interacts with FtsH